MGCEALQAKDALKYVYRFSECGIHTFFNLNSKATHFPTSTPQPSGKLGMAIQELVRCTDPLQIQELKNDSRKSFFLWVEHDTVGCSVENK